MIYRKIFPVLLLLILGLMQSCSNSSKDDPGFNCAASDLAIRVVSSIKSECDIPGSILVKGEGGESPYMFSINGNDYQDSESFENIFAGNFTLLVKDNLGCTASVDFTLNSEPSGITLTLSSTNSECLSSTGSIIAEASGGVGSLVFSIDNGAFSEASTFNALAAGDHIITVKDEENCPEKKSIRVRTNTSLTNNVMPIIQSNCAISGCHNGTQNPRLTTKEEIIQHATSIKSETQSGSMPRDGTLLDDEIDLIACWVNDGALNN